MSARSRIVAIVFVENGIGQRQLSAAKQARGSLEQSIQPPESDRLILRAAGQPSTPACGSGWVGCTIHVIDTRGVVLPVRVIRAVPSSLKPHSLRLWNQISLRTVASAHQELPHA